MEVIKDGLETERKFLIEYPDIESILKTEDCTVKHIKQIYLAGGGRIREIKTASAVKYILTVKQHISDIVREEKEWELTREEFLQKSLCIDPHTVPIEKVRYCVNKGGFVWEIDVFPFWNDKAFLEVELTHDRQQFTIPDFVKVIKEVTFDRRYRNIALAQGSYNEC